MHARCAKSHITFARHAVIFSHGATQDCLLVPPLTDITAVVPFRLRHLQEEETPNGVHFQRHDTRALCRDCIEPLAGLKLKFYRLSSDRNVTALAVAAPKDTFTPLDNAAVEARRSLLLGEAEIDERGNFSFEFPAASRYDGGPFEVDLYCGTVPRLKPGPRPPQPLQFTITTLQPSWRTVENNSVAA